MSVNTIPKHRLDKAEIMKKYYNDGSIKSEVFHIDMYIFRVVMYYNTGAIGCEHYYNENHKTHGLAYGQYRNGKLAKQIYFQNGIAMYGYYYKKNGLKMKMTPKQLQARNHEGI